MTVILIMLAGVIIGYRWFPEKYARKNTLLQMSCTAVLIFAMGVKLGSRENFLEELTSMGFTSVLFAVIPILFSVLLVYILTERFLKKTSQDQHTEGD